MNEQLWVRRTHRLVSVTFTAASSAIFIALGVGTQPARWVYYAPLLPLALLVISGTYMFIAPYAKRRRSVRGGRTLGAAQS